MLDSINEKYKYIDVHIIQELGDLLKWLALLFFLIVLVSFGIRFLFHLIILEVKINRIKNQKLKGTLQEDLKQNFKQPTEDYTISLKVYAPKSVEESKQLRADRELRENVSSVADVTMGSKQYLVDIKQLPQDMEEANEIERRREIEFNKFMKNLSEEEKSEIQDNLGSFVSESDLISYRELYLVFKGVEKEYRSKMISRLNNLEKNCIRLRGRIDRSGVAKNNSILYIKRYNMLKHEVAVYMDIVEHRSLLRKLLEIEKFLQKLANKHPFLENGYHDTPVNPVRNPIRKE